MLVEALEVCYFHHKLQEVGARFEYEGPAQPFLRPCDPALLEKWGNDLDEAGFAPVLNAPEATTAGSDTPRAPTTYRDILQQKPKMAEGPQDPPAKRGRVAKQTADAAGE